MSYWNDKRVLITGGSAGLGLALARTFLNEGARVLIVGRDQKRLEAAAGKLNSDRVLTCSADLTSDADVERVFELVDSEWQGLDVLVNNVGQSTRGHALSTSPEDFARSFDINFLTMARCTSRASEALIASRGHVVNIGSLASKSTAPLLGAYPPSKFAVAAYSQQLRWELGTQGVNVLLVCPGPIRRDDAGTRYDDQSEDLPDPARLPGGGVKVKGIDPVRLADRILRACKRRKKELIVPGRAKILFILSQLSPGLGDWLVRKMTKQ